MRLVERTRACLGSRTNVRFPPARGWSNFAIDQPGSSEIQDAHRQRCAYRLSRRPLKRPELGSLPILYSEAPKNVCICICICCDVVSTLGKPRPGARRSQGTLIYGEPRPSVVWTAQSYTEDVVSRVVSYSV